MYLRKQLHLSIKIQKKQAKHKDVMNNDFGKGITSLPQSS